MTRYEVDCSRGTDCERRREEAEEGDEEGEEGVVVDFRKNGMFLPSCRHQLMTSAKTIDATFEN